MRKIFNFALKIKGGGREGGTREVLRPYHPPPQKKKFGTCTLSLLAITRQIERENKGI